MKVILTQFHGATNTRASHYSATDGDCQRVRVEARDDFNSDQNHEAALRKLCSKLGWTGSLVRGTLMRGGRTVGYVWTWRQERLKVAYETAIVSSAQFEG